MARGLFNSLVLAICGFFAVSCLIENDMSYPAVLAQFTSIEVEGQKGINIDPESRHVEIVLDELADMSRLKLLSFKLNDGAEVVGSLPEYLDLTQPITVTLKVYHEY